MKDILLSAVVISALVVAGIGGTLADFSDSEEERDDTIQAGSLDLKVDNRDDGSPGGIGHFSAYLAPEAVKDVTKELRNVGTINGYFFIMVNEVSCVEANDKPSQPEPETVSEDGGWIGQKQVPGIGENCTAFSDHVRVLSIKFGPAGNTTDIDLSAYENAVGNVTLHSLEDHQIYIGVLPQCGDVYEIEYKFQFVDIPEEYFDLNIFDLNDPHECKWNNWPTNAYMGDKIQFDILYELLQDLPNCPAGA